MFYGMKISLNKRNSLNLICFCPHPCLDPVDADMCCNRCYLSFWLPGLKVFSISCPQWDLSSLVCTRRMLLASVRKNKYLYSCKCSTSQLLNFDVKLRVHLSSSVNSPLCGWVFFQDRETTSEEARDKSSQCYHDHSTHSHPLLSMCEKSYFTHFQVKCCSDASLKWA